MHSCNGRHALHELQLQQSLQQRNVAIQRRPRGEGDEGRGERNARGAGERDRAVEVAARMILGEQAQDAVVDGLHSGRDEHAPAAPKLGQQLRVSYEVLNLDGGIKGDAGKRVMQRPGQPEPMRRAVEEIRVTEGNMRRPVPDLLRDVFQHHVHRDDAKASLVHRDHRAVPAQVLAAPAALDEAADAGGAVWQHQVGVAREFGQAAAVRHLERDSAQADDRLALGRLRSTFGRRCSICPQSLANRQQRRLHLPAQHGAHAQSAQQRLVHGRVEPVDAEVRVRGESLDVGQGLDRDAGGGMHAHMNRHQARISQDVGIELLQRKIEACHRKALALEQRRRLRQAKRLPPQFIGVDEDDLEGQSLRAMAQPGTTWTATAEGGSLF